MRKPATIFMVVAFAGAVWPEEAEHFAGGNREGDGIDGEDAVGGGPESLGEVFEFDEWWHGRACSAGVVESEGEKTLRRDVGDCS